MPISSLRGNWGRETYIALDRTVPMRARGTINSLRIYPHLTYCSCAKILGLPSLSTCSAHSPVINEGASRPYPVLILVRIVILDPGDIFPKIVRSTHSLFVLDEDERIAELIGRFAHHMKGPSGKP